MHVSLIIQARVNSTRLPGKMFLPLGDRLLIQHVVERCLRVEDVQSVIVAYPVTDPEIPAVLGRYANLKLYAYAGNESDLVARFHAACQKYGTEIVLRVPADNPCVDPVIITKHLNHFLSLPTMFSSSQLVDEDRWVFDGLGTEICFANWYSYLHSNHAHPAWLEHPHQYFEQGCIVDYPYHRSDGTIVPLHVNTWDDYVALKPAFERVYAEDREFAGVEVGKELVSRNIRQALV